MPPSDIQVPAGRINVTVGLNPDDWRSLKELAQLHGTTAPELIRQLIRAERKKRPQ